MWPFVHKKTPADHIATVECQQCKGITRDLTKGSVSRKELCIDCKELDEKIAKAEAFVVIVRARYDEIRKKLNMSVDCDPEFLARLRVLGVDLRRAAKAAEQLQRDKRSVQNAGWED